MKKLLKESGDPFRDIVKQYAKMYRDNELARIDKEQYYAWLQAHADKINPTTRAAIEKKVDAQIGKKNEASTSSAVGGVMTPFAFSKRGTGNVRAATQLGYKLAKTVPRDKDLSLENQMYSEPAYVSPAQDIEPVDTWVDKHGLVQHGDPELDPALAGYKQGRLPFTEVDSKFKQISKIVEGLNSLRYRLKEADAPVAAQPAPAAQPAQPAPQQAAPKATGEPNVQVQTYNLQPDFTDFDTQLKNSTEDLKLKLQKEIQDNILNKKIVVRASKGFKQPETDYTINVTGVNIDYYYDRYVIIIVGREENKQKTAKFFVKPGYKIKILGSADVKPKDKYQIAKSKALVEPKSQSAATGSNTATSDEPTPQPEQPQDKTGAQPAPATTTA